jgi:signal transduction histidine kinase
MVDQEQKPTLQIDPRVVRQLGAELITDPEQALLELIKNSYDADADRCRVTIDTRTEVAASESARGERLRGEIAVEDDGPRVTLDEIKKRWLLISGSEKRPPEGAQKTLTPKRNRAPLGDKGIGRLGTMRLGDRVTFVSRRRGSSSIAKGVEFRWSEFASVSALSAVPVREVAAHPTDRFSTLVRIEGLEERDRWEKREDSELQAQISKLVSPFTDKHDLFIEIYINGDKLELQKLRHDLDLQATARYSFAYSQDNEHHLNLTCLYADAFFGSGWNSAEAGEFFEQFQKKRPQAGLQIFKKTGPARWIFQIRRRIDCGTIKAFNSRESPGSFSGEIYSVTFSKDAETSGVTPPSVSSKRLFQKLSGVMIYRDGFGVRIPPDWLELGAGVTSGGSWYGLRPQNTIGYIDITTRQNSLLVEKSDREGFVDNPAWRQFVGIVSKVRDEINGIAAELRRSASGKKPNVDQPTADAAIKTLVREANFGHTAKRTLTQQRGVLAQAIDLAGRLPPDKRTTAFKAQAQKALDEVTRQSRVSLSEVPTRDAAELLKSEFENLRSQVRTAYDFIAAGMAAETLAHEVHPLLDRALRNLSDAEKNARKVGLKDVSVNLQGARAYIRLVGKQLTMLNPMLKIYRETKDTIDVLMFIDEYRDYVSSRIKEARIELTVLGNRTFHVQLPRGRLMQVIDNLVRNSEYWLTVPSAVQKTPKPQIAIEIKRPTITVWDNGLGVRPELGNQIFEMFVTDKRKDEGRGLGLFISREILMRYGCNIELSEQTNAYGRRFKFVVDLATAAA